jgi:hypothetical protein
MKGAQAILSGYHPKRKDTSHCQPKQVYGQGARAQGE